MENKKIARTLRLLSQLMELHGENPFKVKSMANAAFKVDKLPFAVAGITLAAMEEVEGLGKSTAAKVWELLQTGSIAELDNLLEKTPPGIAEMLQIKGLGPKKILIVWKDLGIENVGELYYACNENRLIEAKGFGAKTQEEIKKIIEFRMASSGRYLYARVEDFAEELIDHLKNSFPELQISYTGDYRRKCEIIDGLDLLIGTALNEELADRIQQSGLTVIDRSESRLSLESADGIRTHIDFCGKNDYGWQLIEKTGNPAHVNNLKELLGESDASDRSETEIYALAGIPFVEPELREGTNELELAKQNNLPSLITFEDLKGSLHNHSNWSDGVNSLEEMALFCRDDLKMGYLGICDHSKSAFYAKGLDEIRVAAQQREIDELNKKLAPFRVFKGIESDILYDGSLDYGEEILKTFDFVVASVHSILKMSEEKATQRLITAIENPYTTILGHPTGRMLLARSGYPIDHKKVIDACAANNVVIEINANPVRLDLDWRWHRYAIEKGVMLSVNPDAHRTSGFMDMHYGILVARKGGVSPADCLNCMDKESIERYFQSKKPVTAP